MSNIGPKNKNPNKNIFFFPKDCSNNNPFLDPSGTFFTNPLFSSFHPSNSKKNVLLLKNRETLDGQNHLETKEDDFNKKMNRLLDKIKKNRNDKYFHSKLTDTLDTTASKKVYITDKLSLTDILHNINKKYDQLGDKSDPSSLFNKPPPSKYTEKYSVNRQNAWKYYAHKSLLPPAPPPKPPRLKPAPPIVKTKVNIMVEITSLKDLLNLIDSYPLDIDKEYNINMEAIHKIKEPLGELNNMIGMNQLKTSIVDQILYFVQNLHRDKNNKNGDFMHTVIYGPPGTGKTEVAKIMGKIFSKLGILSRNKFKKVTRADLIAGYLGQTAIKTRDVIKDCLGGVLFIDEAYALGNPEKRDSFAKECIDTLCESLSDNKDNLMVIIAGYEEELKKCFFGYNQGLDSRFTWRFKTDDYKESELNLILQKKIIDASWKLKEKLPDSWFKSRMEYFTYFGRDMETLLAKTKIAHSRRVFCLPANEKKNLIKKDFDSGYKLFLDNDEVKQRKDKLSSLISTMYC